MRTSNLAIFMLISVVLGARGQGVAPTTTSQAASATQNLPSPTAYAVTKQDGSSRVWERLEYETGPNGKVTPKKHSYTELATGLNYLKNGQWMASKEEIDVLPQGGAEAIQGQHQVYFPGNINTGVIKVVTPDGKPMQSRPLAIFYDDGKNTVALAVLTNSVGLLVGSNQVIYPNAFSGLKADLRYTYKKVGFEQDIVLQQQPHPPEYYGLDPAKTRLQVLTEYIGTADPLQKASAVNQADGLNDTTLTFGQMKMVQGKAFAIGNSNPPRSLHGGAAVYKSWQHIAGRTFLVEELPVKAIAAQLGKLPLQASADTASPANSILQKVSTKRLLPTTRLADADNKPILIAKADISYKSGVVLDYVSFDYTSGDVLFQGDTTYLISGGYTISGTTTIEGGAVIKYDGSEDPYFTVSGPLNCKTTPYRPAIFTSIDDNTVGETISGSTGTPPAWDSPYYDYYLFMDGSSLSYNAHDLRFCYAYTGLGEWDTGPTQVRDCQFVQCLYGMDVNSVDEVSFYNVLFAGCGNAVSFDQEGCSFTAENMTADVGRLWADGFSEPSSYNLTNCIILGSIGSGITLNTNRTVINPSGTVFQTVGGGNYYLADGSPYRNAGMTNIDSTLLADIATKTTYPPIVYSNTTISVATTFSPQAQRDTDTPDLGYHYDPIDYVVGETTLSNNVALNLTAGTVLGWFRQGSYGGAGLWLSSGAQFNSAGTVTSPCQVSHYSLVQESAGNWAVGGWGAGIMLNGGDPSNLPQMNCQFTHWSDLTAADFRDYWAYGVGNFSDCEFYNNAIASYRPSLYFTNCLFFREDVAFWAQADAASFTFKNCTFYNGGMALCRYSGQSASFWTIQDTAFDGTGFLTSDNLSGNTSYTFFDYNAYNTANVSWETYPYLWSLTGTLETTGAHDVSVTDYNWQDSWLGDFYLPSGSTLIDKGSTTADLVGLYHFTTQVSQVPETNSIVDIGYHYVAVGPDPEGMVAYWPFDEGSGSTAGDATGNGYNGTLVNSPTWMSSGKINGALTMDTGNGGSEVTVSSVPLGSTWTASWWSYFPLATFNSSWRTMFRSFTSGSDHQVIVDPSGNLGMYDNDLGSYFNSSGYNVNGLSGWHHLAAVYSGGVTTFYVDGVAVGSVTKQNTDNIDVIGNYQGGYQNWGGLDDLRIYSRALSAGEISSLATGVVSPLDTNGDGIPDYLEDANGNGVVDSGEIGWNISGDLGLKVVITKPRNGSLLP